MTDQADPRHEQTDEAPHDGTVTGHETAADRGRRPIVVVGLMGAGKTTLARALAARLGWPMRDSDEDVEALWGRPASDIADEAGAEELHRREREVLLDALGERPPVVVAAAASTLDSSSTIEALDRARVVWLDTGPDVLAARFHSRPGRPVYGEALEVLRDQDRRRRPTFVRVADVTLEATVPTDEQVATAVAELGLDGGRS